MSLSIFITFNGIVSGLILGSAVLTKIARPHLISLGVRRYQLLPKSLELPVAAGLVMIELLVAAALLSGTGGWAAFAVSAGLFLFSLW